MSYQDIFKCRSRKLSTQAEHKPLGALLIAEPSQRWRRLAAFRDACLGERNVPDDKKLSPDGATDFNVDTLINSKELKSLQR